jgi:uncharacterized protein
VRRSRTAWVSPDPPVSVRRPMLYQDWRDCSFLHWSYEPGILRQHVPRGFEVETFEGRAWVSLISFRISMMRPGALPPIPGLRTAVESHLRTYVVGPDGRRGIWMLSLDIAPLAAAVLGRFGFALPYWWSRMEVSKRGNTVTYRVRRQPRQEARLDLQMRLGAAIDDTKLGELDHFLTARWVLYSGVGSIHAAILTEHPRWRFRQASVLRLNQTVTPVGGLPPANGAPLVHFSEGVDARLSWPRLSLSPPGA